MVPLDSLTEQVHNWSDFPPLSSAGVQTFTRSCSGELRRTADSQRREVRTVAAELFTFRRLINVIRWHTGACVDFAALARLRKSIFERLMQCSASLLRTWAVLVRGILVGRCGAVSGDEMGSVRS